MRIEQLVELVQFEKMRSELPVPDPVAGFETRSELVEPAYQRVACVFGCHS